MTPCSLVDRFRRFGGTCCLIFRVEKEVGFSETLLYSKHTRFEIPKECNRSRQSSGKLLVHDTAAVVCRLQFSYRTSILARLPVFRLVVSQNKHSKVIKLVILHDSFMDSTHSRKIEINMPALASFFFIKQNFSSRGFIEITPFCSTERSATNF
jgi:hypothetical protein